MKVIVDFQPAVMKDVLALVDAGTFKTIDDAFNKIVTYGLTLHAIQELTNPAQKSQPQYTPDRLVTGLSPTHLIEYVVKEIIKVAPNVLPDVEYTASSLVARLPLSIQTEVRPNMASRIGVKFAEWAKRQTHIKVVEKPRRYINVRQV